MINNNIKDKAPEILLKYWGYNNFLPFQEKAILSILDKKDTLTILPTGGGKSVCFQVPALLCDGVAIIISPLISLMKDQVDYLKDIGIEAECLNSSQNQVTQQIIINKLLNSKLKLLYISPERLMYKHVRDMLNKVKLSFFVIDEAHCISHWGHNFREEYRQLGIIKYEFKNINVHAFTATATPEVQKDIVEMLKLDSPHLYVGNIDRPNLTYRLIPRSNNIINQITNVIKKHNNEAGIIYCLRRTDVNEISERLNNAGYRNLPYHAGLADNIRKKHQDEFSSENVSIIVATIAFGMGIDRSNIRYVIHAAMPKSIEHYQQETGRAGRDGLLSDCYMFYSGHDYKIWEFMLSDVSNKEIMLSKLRSLYNFCTRPECRHKYLVSYFGQQYTNANCGACDYCLGEVDMVNDPLIVGQKILSCVIRVKEKFGADHVSCVLKGDITENITKWGHNKLSTFSLMNNETKVFIRYMIDQLLGQGFLKRDIEFSTLSVTETGRQLLKGEIVPILAKPIISSKKKEIEKKHKIIHADDWAGIDEKLFELLRTKRAELAREKSVPAYIIFSDKTLRDMAQAKPNSIEQLSGVFGVGEVKLRQYGEFFLKLINGYIHHKK
ncbi:DNA helicase RecQ [Candidatus Poribacteria bacterium]|nr:DNA helicase RecQ [Candidatus Poribacteria bacterium]